MDIGALKGGRAVIERVRLFLRLACVWCAGRACMRKQASKKQAIVLDRETVAEPDCEPVVRWRGERGAGP